MTAVTPGGGPSDDKKGAHGQPTLPNIAPLTDSERLQKEKEILGFYISGHPLEPFRSDCELNRTHLVADIGAWRPGPMKLAAVLTACGAVHRNAGRSPSTDG